MARLGWGAKLANNTVGLGTVALLLEVRALARAYGMPAGPLMEIFKQASANSFVVQHWAAIWGPLMGLGLNDLRLGVEAAQDCGVRMPLIEATLLYSISPEAEDPLAG